MKAPVVCIDGPAASGKTTIALAMAERLGYFYLDTGVLYRAVTWVALKRGIAPGDAESLTRLASELTIEVSAAPPGDIRQTIVIAEGEDISLKIRTPEVDINVSEVSAHAGVRTALIDIQRSLAEKGGVLMAGRDMGTVVLPTAEVKLFLIASDDERARRRQRQAEAQGIKLDFDAVLADLRRRDRYDSTRAIAPLRPADDAVIIDTTSMTVDQVVERALELLREKSGSQAPDQ